MMIFNKALQALNLPETQLPIVLSALETKNNPNDVIALKDITVRMFETHRVHADRTDIYGGAENILAPPPFGLVKGSKKIVELGRR